MPVAVMPDRSVVELRFGVTIHNYSKATDIVMTRTPRVESQPLYNIVEPIVDQPAAGLMATSRAYVVTGTPSATAGATVRSTITATVSMPVGAMTLAQLRTVFRLLGAGPRDAIRAAIAAPANDADTPAVYVSKERARIYITTDRDLKELIPTMDAIEVLRGVPLTTPQTTEFTTQWNIALSL